MPIFTIQRPSKIFPNWDFWFENKPSGYTAKYLLMSQASVIFANFIFQKMFPGAVK
jgi:hypothetical protein